MNLLSLSFAYLRARALNTALNLVLLALGLATIVLLLLFGAQMQDRLTRDARGVDLVVGAKGSPMQLILSSVYHVDVPTGNIPHAALDRLAAHRFVASVIPLALGDSHAGFRIVGTEHSYPAHFSAELAEGRLWRAPFEATIGAMVAAESGLRVGDAFVGSHGLVAGGPAHDQRPYRVVGIMAPTGSVLDRLILTSMASVWSAHEHHRDESPALVGRANAASPGPEAGHDPGREDEHHRTGEHAHDDDAGPQAHEADEREVTALLVRYKTPLAAVVLPREINRESALQAAVPALEMARLYALVGIGLDTLRGFGLLLILTAALGIFIALYNAMQERRYDIAIMRSLGATRTMVLRQVLLEGLMITAAGAVLGIAVGHVAAEALGRWLPQADAMGLTGQTWRTEEWYIFALALGLGVVSALVPALQAYRTDVARTLARG